MRWCNSFTIRCMRSCADLASFASCASSVFTSFDFVAEGIGEILSQPLADVHRYIGNTFETGGLRKALRMNGRSQRVQSAHQSGCGSVQEFIGNAINPALPRSPHVHPAPVLENFLQRHAVARPAPGG